MDNDTKGAWIVTGVIVGGLIVYSTGHGLTIYMWTIIGIGIIYLLLNRK